MAEKIISPGVFTKEVDQSFLPAGVQAIGAAVIGPTVKGPVLIPTIVSSYSEFSQIFGDTFSSGSGAYEDTYKYLTSYSAQEYLKYADTLTVVRVADDASTAVSTISSSTTVGDGTAVGSLTIANNLIPEDEVQILVAGTEYRFIASDAPTGTLPVDSSPIFYYTTGSSVAVTLDNLVAEINTAAIGVTALDLTTALGLSASSAGTSGNSITVQTGSGATITTTQLTLAGGTNTTTSADCLTFTTLTEGALQNSSGTEGTNGLLANGDKDNIRWEITSVNNAKGTFNLQIRRGNDTNTRKSILESYNNLNLDPNSPNYVAKRIGDEYQTLVGSGNSEPYLQYNGDFANRSKYVRVTVHQKTLNYLDSNGTIRDGSLSGSLPNVSSGSFNGGTDGNVNHPKQMYENISNTNSQGMSMSLASTQTAYKDAINLLKNQDQYDINLLTLPGIVDNLGTNHSSIITAAINAVEARGDCFLVLDPAEYNLGSSGITVVTGKVSERDSNYAASYWPWVKIPDADLGQNVWVPAGVVIPGVYAFNDRVAAPWFAPAGLNRGGIDMAIRAERKLTQTNRDDLYDSNVNPIATFPNTGVTVYGQKTMQKKASALDRVNVRRLLIAAKKFIASTTKFLVFENNTAATRNKFLSIVNPYFESVQQRQGLYAFKVVMDSSNNTPDVIDRNQMVGQIFLQPAKTAEFILIDFNILPTGAAFPE
tara:strand:- start:3216 stop:5342 length:2127 start_codon:yes stop_codon:yes gene_type:complete